MEWKFARTQIWLGYFDTGHTLPSPFNLIPTVHDVLSLVRKILKKDDIDTKHALVQRSEAARYSKLQGRLIQTLFAKIERDKATEQLEEIEKKLQKVMQRLEIS